MNSYPKRHVARAAGAWLAAGCGAATLALAGGASAQSYGNLDGLFRYEIAIGGATQAPFDFDDAETVGEVLEDANLRARYPFYNGTQSVLANLDFRGLQVIGRYNTGNNDFFVEIPGSDTSLCQNAALGLAANAPCTFRYSGGTRAQNYLEFEDDVEELDNEFLTKLLFRNLARRSPIDPLAGNPNSIQSKLVRQGLDLSAPDSSLDRSNAESGEPWLVGLAYSRVSGGRFDGDNFNARIQRSFRFVEGSRGQLKVTLPLSVTVFNGATVAEGTVGAGYEFEAIKGRWTLEPRVGYGLTYSEELLSAGQMFSASLTSRYRVDGLGRGYLLIGNMIGYTSTLSTGGLLGADIDPGIKNTVFRNGLAYEMPLNSMLGGRASSIRASYTLTNMQGDDLFLENFSEVAVSYGVRSRGDDVRNTFELFRFGLVGTFGDDYKSVTAMFGARF